MIDRLIQGNSAREFKTASTSEAQFPSKLSLTDGHGTSNPTNGADNYRGILARHWPTQAFLQNKTPMLRKKFFLQKPSRKTIRWKRTQGLKFWILELIKKLMKITLNPGIILSIFGCCPFRYFLRKKSPVWKPSYDIWHPSVWLPGKSLISWSKF